MFEKDEDYKKARKESKDRITKVIKVWGAREETLHDEGFQKGAEYGYNKANEWHFVKDGEYPTHSNRVLVLTDEGVGFGIYGLDNKKWYTYDTGFKVIAWKEIVPPDLSSSELYRTSEVEK